MGDKYSFYRGFYDILMRHGKELPDDKQADARFQMMAGSTVMKNVFGRLYRVLTEGTEMEPIEKMPIEYKKELWEIANQFMQDKSVDEKSNYCKCIMATLWLMNN